MLFSFPQFYCTYSFTQRKKNVFEEIMLYFVNYSYKEKVLVTVKKRVYHKICTSM